MQCVLVLAATTGYQTRSFGEAAERMGVELVYATDRCHLIEDPWHDQAIPIRFHDEDASVSAILDVAKANPFDGVIAVGDRPTVIAARVAQALGLPWHAPESAAVARHKLLTRERLRDAGLPVPWFFTLPSAAGSQARRTRIPSFPCAVKPVALSGSRGVMRADDRASLAEALERLRTLLRSPEIRAERNDAHETILVPFFEETIYVTPSSAPSEVQERIIEAIASAAKAIGLHHGPLHAECRVTPSTGSGRSEVFVLEVAARPIGGLCARTLRFTGVASPRQAPAPLEELLLRHVLGEAPGAWRRENAASGVMMIPIPGRGILRGVEGVEAARQIVGIDDVRITAKPDQLLVPLPEGASYLGFIFARAADVVSVRAALAAAHRCLTFVIDPELPVLRPSQIHYNRQHG